MRKFLIALLVALPILAHAQTTGIINGATPIVGGSSGQCVTKGSNGTVSMASCGGGGSPTTSQTITGTSAASPAWQVQLTGDTNARLAAGLNAADVPGLALGSGGGAADAFLARGAAASFQFGGSDAAAPVSQVIGVQNVVAGTSNTAGAALLIRGSIGTGTGAGGSVGIQVAPASSTGSTQNALVSRANFTTTGITLGNSTANAVPIASGTTAAAGFQFRLANLLTGAVNTRGMRVDGAAQSDVTTRATYYDALAGTAAASFTLPDLEYFRAQQGTFGAGSTVTAQYGFYADSTLIGATTNYGFYSSIPISGTSRYAFYGAGTAPSHFGGAVDITGTVATSAPAGASAGLWKLGSLVTGAVVVDTTRSVYVDIGGVVYKLLVAQ